MKRSKTSGAFTLVELLVVIGIIAILIGLLLPALKRARQAALEVQDQSNIRQWGIAFYAYADANKGALPCDGDDGSTSAKYIGYNAASTPPRFAMESSAYWFNALPPLIKQKSYITQLADDAAGRVPLAHAGDNSIFICPAAGDPISNILSEVSADHKYFMLYGKISDPTYALSGLSVNSVKQFKSFFSYGVNSKLFGVSNDGVDHEAWKLTQLRPASSVVLMTEKIGQAGEYNPNPTPFGQGQSPKVTAQGYTGNIGQPKACWTRFTTRHRKGGFLLFADGHVGWYRWTDLNPISAINQLNANLQDFNQPGFGVIWNPISGIGNKGE